MKHANEKRFEDFFEERKYVVLKNYLYNYLLRRRAVGRAVDEHGPGLVLEIGSGLSPMITGRDDVVYSELSFRALKTLKAGGGRGHHVVADGTRLPFRDGAFRQAVCSEVLEHVEDHETALAELARVLAPGGHACITVPHRQFYFAADDRFVGHFRRYERAQVEAMLDSAGLRLGNVSKVLGPLEKVTMFSTVMMFSLIQRIGGGGDGRTGGALAVAIAPLFKCFNRGYAILARMDAALMPVSLATVLLFSSIKGDGAKRMNAP